MHSVAVGGIDASVGGRDAAKDSYLFAPGKHPHREHLLVRLLQLQQEQEVRLVVVVVAPVLVVVAVPVSS